MAGLIVGTGAMDKKEVFKWYTETSPATPLEKEWKDKIDPVEMEIFFHKMMMIVATGKETMVKVGTSPGMTGTDLNCAIFTAEGDVAIGGMGVYIHILSGSGAIKYYKTYFKDSMGINDGDLFYVTDPYIGGTHVNDQFLVTPVFVDRELVAWVASGCHQGEVGAVEVGMPVRSPNRYGDGMSLTTVKIGEGLKFRDDMVIALANMCRDPQGWISDLKARYAALVHMRNELIKLGQERGAGFVAGVLRKLIEDTMEFARKKISQYNDGTYRGVIFCDTIGSETYLTRVCLTITKKGDSLYVDFTGTSPQVPGSINTYNYAIPAAFALYLMPYAFHEMPTSQGVVAPIKGYDVPENSMISPDPSCSTGVSVGTLNMVYGVVHQIFSKMVFDSSDREVVCAAQGWSLDGFQSLLINQRGLTNATFNLDGNAQGQGGRHMEDGTDSMNPTWAALADCLDVEWYEKDLPFVYLFRRHSPNSGGFGKYRGGSGIESGWFAHNLRFGLVTTVGSGTKVPSVQGLFGGYGSTLGPGVHVWKSNIQEMIEKGEKLPKSIREVIEMMGGSLEIGPKYMSLREYSTGDLFTSQNGGGGGYGDVLERDPHKVIEDLRLRAITDRTAENVYKVSYDKETLALDEKKTEELRKAERENRKKRGKRYEEFEKEWFKLKPKSEALKYFGPWPH